MGLINFGVPEKETEFLKKSLGLDIFVEGGTYKGDTAKIMSADFRKVYTIEKSEVMFDIAKEKLGGIKNITLLKGDSREHLQKILDENDNILFWLDAHWSGGDTYGEEDECPLIEELEIIFSNPKNYVILIDDARLFLAPPPYPHNFQNWPSLKKVIQSLPSNCELIVFEDVIYIYNAKFDNPIKLFMQEQVTVQWEKYGKENQASFIKGLKMVLRGVSKGKFV